MTRDGASACAKRIKTEDVETARIAVSSAKGQDNADARIKHLHILPLVLFTKIGFLEFAVLPAVQLRSTLLCSAWTAGEHVSCTNEMQNSAAYASHPASFDASVLNPRLTLCGGEDMGFAVFR